MGGHGCVAAVCVALIVGLEKRGIQDAASYCPWYFPTVDDYTARLERAGFVVESAQLIPRPTRCRQACAAGWKHSRIHFVRRYRKTNEEFS